jgi:hypothetical protein
MGHFFDSVIRFLAASNPYVLYDPDQTYSGGHPGRDGDADTDTGPVTPRAVLSEEAIRREEARLIPVGWTAPPWLDPEPPVR